MRRRASRLRALAALLAAGLIGLGAYVLEQAPAPPGPPRAERSRELPQRFPRVAAIYSKGSTQNTEPTQRAISMFSLYVGDMVNWHTPSAADGSLTQGWFYRQQNPDQVELMYFHSSLYPESEYTPEQFTINGTRYYIDPAWYLTYAGSSLTEDVSASGEELRVRDLGAFAADDRVLLGGVAGQSRAEIAVVTSKSAPNGPGTLRVVRGLLSQGGRFAPIDHRAGDYVRTIAHAFGDPDAMMLDVTASAPTSAVNDAFGEQSWNQFAASFLAQKLSDPAYAGIDGYFLDNFVDRAVAIVDHPARVDRYRTNTASGIDDRAWSAGMLDLASRLRATLPADLLLVGNSGGDTPETFGRYLNGGMIEGLDDGGAGLTGDLAASLGFYWSWMQRGRGQATFIVNGSPRAESLAAGAAAYRTMRLLLTLTMTHDGFLALDEYNVTGGHQTLWWFDEFDGGGRGVGYLGRPTGSVTQPAPGVYRRDFENGIALSNTTASPRTIDLEAPFQRLKGTQAPLINDGSVTTTVWLAPLDGLILLRAPVASRILPPGLERLRGGLA